MIQLRDVSVRVPVIGRNAPDRTLLDAVSLDLTEHRIAVIGANGSGKLTLLRLLNGLRTPSSGQVLVAGHDTVEEAKTVRSLVGFVFTDPLAQLLMPTPVEDVELSLRTRIRNRVARADAAQRLLDERGIGRVAHQSIYDLSGGERQLVALTSVLAVEPEVIVADEPTTLLDLRNKLMLRDIFETLPQQLIFSTHDLDFAREAQRVIVIDGGRVMADGDPDAAIAAYAGAMRA